MMSEETQRLMQGINALTSTIGKAEGIVHDELDALVVAMNEKLHQLERGYCDVVVQGSFTVGKSLFINALLGQDLLPTSTMSCTSFPVLIEEGESEAVTLYQDGQERTMSLQEFQQWAPYTTEDLNELMHSGNSVRLQDVTYARICIKHPLLACGLRIIDSPGLDDNCQATTFASHAASVSSLMVFLCDARGLTQLDLEYLKKFARKDTLFVLNKKDLYMSGEQDKVVCHTLDLLHTICPDESVETRLLAVSARQARTAQRGMKWDWMESCEKPVTEEHARMLYRSSGMPEVRTALESFAERFHSGLFPDESVSYLLDCSSHALTSFVLQLEERHRQALALLEEEQKNVSYDLQQCQDNVKKQELAFDAFLQGCQQVCHMLPQEYAAAVRLSWDKQIQNICKQFSIKKSDYWQLGVDHMNPFLSQKECEERAARLMEPFFVAVTEYLEREMKDIVQTKELQFCELEHKLNDSLGFACHPLPQGIDIIYYIQAEPDKILLPSTQSGLGKSACKSILATLSAQLLTGGIGALLMFLFVNSRVEGACQSQVVAILNALREEILSLVTEQAERQCSMLALRLTGMVNEARKNCLMKPKAHIFALQKRHGVLKRRIQQEKEMSMINLS